MASGSGVVKSSRPKQESVAGALKTLPSNAVLGDCILMLFSALRRAKSTTTTKPEHKPTKRQTFKIIFAGEKSDDSDSSDVVAVATSDSNDVVAREAVNHRNKNRGRLPIDSEEVILEVSRERTTKSGTSASW